MSRLYKKDDDVIVTNDSLQKTFKKINTQLEGLTVEVRESGGGLVLIVRGSEAFEGCTITAQCKLDNREYAKTLENGIAIIKVKLPGEYFIKNSHNDTMITCTIGEPFIDEVYFTDFYGSITCTVPELLIGETLEAKNGEHTVEKEIKSTVEVLDVYNQGTWSVGIKGTEFITPQEAVLQEMGESKTVNLTLEGAAYITVTLADEIKTERITCKNGEEFTRTKTPIDGQVKFFVPTLANYTVCLEQSELIKKEVNVEAQQEYQVTLDLSDLSVPVLLVTSKEENEGKIIKVSRADTTYEKPLINGAALYIIEEKGEYTISCDDLPDKKRTIQITENKLYTIRFGGYIFGIRVKQEEADPAMRIEVLQDTDLYGLRPISVDQQTGVVDYGDMEDTFLFQAFNNPVLLSIDGQEEIPLNKNNYTLKSDSSPTPAAGLTSNYNTFSRVNKVYTYMYDKDGYEYYYIAEDKVDDNYDAIGFTREDDSEADCFYFGTYMGDWDTQGRLRSVSGVYTKNFTSYTDMANSARKNGDGYTMEQHQQVVLFEIFDLMMTQSYDSPHKIGLGRAFALDFPNVENTKHTLAITGVLNTSGPIGYLATEKHEQNNYNRAVKFMHVEDLWTYGASSFEEGLLSSQYKYYVRMKPPYITEDGKDRSTYTEVPGSIKPVSQSNQYQPTASTVSNRWGRIGIKEGGSNTTYECSNWGVELSNPTTYRTGHRGNSNLFNRITYIDFTSTHFGGGGARLCYIPPKKS